MFKSGFAKILNWFNPTLSNENFDRSRRRISSWEQVIAENGYENAIESRLIKRIKNDLDKGDLNQAISRCEGFFECNFSNQKIHELAAKLYIQKGERVKAGKHLFFKYKPSEIEMENVKEFEKSCGNSPTLILKKVIPKQLLIISDMDSYSKLKLKKMIAESTDEMGVTPNFLKAHRNHLEKLFCED